MPNDDSAGNKPVNGNEGASEAQPRPSNFIRDIILKDIASGKHDGRVQTRFPPEPNGYLHIGHAKSICLNFGLAAEFNGKCNLRFDDTNPCKEEVEYVDSIIEDVRWMGFQPDGVYYASDYFGQLHAWAIDLIKAGKAYVCDLTAEEVRKYRGTLSEPGTESPYRNRTIEENLDLFERMGKGEFPDGTRTLRSKIDMTSPNLNMRDPVMYRILHADHHRTGGTWCIYPMYDFTHGQSDSIEKISHSICTLEFEDHRPLYDWYIESLGIFPPQQIEFDRLNLTYTLLSKRKLLALVQNKVVSGWDDPRMPTLSGIRRRGYTPEAMRTFCSRIGVSKTNGTIELGLLEHAVREDLNKRAARVMAVLKPIKVIIDNYPEGQVEEMEAVNNPEDESMGTRQVPFSREIYIEQDDFREVPPKGYYRLSPGKEVRLRYAYLITCTSVLKNQAGEVVEVHCSYDPATRGGNTPDGRKVKSTIHWVSAPHAISAEVRMYENLFSKEDPNDVAEGRDWMDNLNPHSLEVVTGGKLEPSLSDAAPGNRYQFERLGYFCADTDSKPGSLVFNRTVGLRDSWAKIEKAQNQKEKGS
ncbi:glutamine--tRNA ligase/YqeY domain fusion protein [Paludibaculum fermentans]|uniref:Glutamine--tRNA ligase n=1 Tax=Paludibaculum fermentans TaxID=1473598 RepID=A0A7S7SKN1_PALFE|nr:glutamine--tRNA ligase/YqeY domain fusion protein [Paludibaculum fermentans]QOY87220.1 glutamine--tRNA ligase/YqeY domain fusion protein [Paludibaculum fermentans]